MDRLGRVVTGLVPVRFVGSRANLQSTWRPGRGDRGLSRMHDAGYGVFGKGVRFSNEGSGLGGQDGSVMKPTASYVGGLDV